MKYSGLSVSRGNSVTAKCMLIPTTGEPVVCDTMQALDLLHLMDWIDRVVITTCLLLSLPGRNVWRDPQRQRLVNHHPGNARPG